MEKSVVCLMGPTASGKTEIAVRLCKRFPFDIVSVDSALVYRHMNIGTAKPDTATLARTPHRLINIRDPEDNYSAGDFVRDAHEQIAAIHTARRIPLLVGGTMMYFRVLTGGIAELPAADEEIRQLLDADARHFGWPAMHERLREIDPEAARRIEPNDSQRIQRALEVFQASGRTLSEWHRLAQEQAKEPQPHFVKLALRIEPRSLLHKRIEARLAAMLQDGFVDEVRQLMQRPGLTRDRPSMRAVGYRQLWAHLAGECSLDEARYRALVATRQLAKRQVTWLRSEQDLVSFDPLEKNAVSAISRYLADTGLIFG